MFRNRLRRVGSVWLNAGVGVAVLGVWAAVGLRHTPSVQVATAEVTAGPIVRHIVATGTLQATATVQVGAQISGTIASLSADFNSIVHKGDVLARLDPSLLDAELRQAEAALKQAEAALAQAEADRDGLVTALVDAQTKATRAEQLAARQLIAAADVDAARAVRDEAAADAQAGASHVSVAAAAVDEARAAAHQAAVNLEHAVITSPIDGIVVSRSVDVGQTVAATLQAPVLFAIAGDFSRMQVEVDIDEADIGGVRAGEAASFEVESYPGERFTGTVAEVRLQPVVDASAATTTPSTSITPTTGSSSSAASTALPVVTYATMINVWNPGERLRPGMTATVVLDGSRVERAVRIPNNALSFRPPADVLAALRQTLEVSAQAATSDGTRRQVWRYDGAQFTPIAVRVGMTDGQWTQLVDGTLDPGETLVSSAQVQR